jgi:hypothetical protein
MSIEVHVLFKGALPSRMAFNTAIGSLGHAIAIVDLEGGLEGQTGFMPMQLFDEDSGVEFDVFDGRDAVEELEPEADQSFDRVANFRWGSSFKEGFLAYCGVAALAQLTGGTIVDEYEGIISIDAAVVAAQGFLAEVSKGSS